MCRSVEVGMLGSSGLFFCRSVAAVRRWRVNRRAVSPRISATTRGPWRHRRISGSLSAHDSSPSSPASCATGFRADARRMQSSSRSIEKTSCWRNGRTTGFWSVSFFCRAVYGKVIAAIRLPVLHGESRLCWGRLPLLIVGAAYRPIVLRDAIFTDGFES